MLFEIIETSDATYFVEVVDLSGDACDAVELIQGDTISRPEGPFITCYGGFDNAVMWPRT